jgi:hypothetical protein
MALLFCCGVWTAPAQYILTSGAKYNMKRGCKGTPESYKSNRIGSNFTMYAPPKIHICTPL